MNQPYYQVEYDVKYLNNNYLQEKCKIFNSINEAIQFLNGLRHGSKDKKNCVVFGTPTLEKIDA